MPADPLSFNPEDNPPPDFGLVAGIPFVHMNRKQKAEFIKDHPDDFMVCHGCRGIDFRAEIKLCPICHAYKHSYEAMYIMAVAHHISTLDADSLPYE